MREASCSGFERKVGVMTRRANMWARWDDLRFLNILARQRRRGGGGVTQRV
jgi:hypothetical protein